MWERLRRVFGGTPEPRQDVVNKAVSLLVEGARIEESKARAIHAKPTAANPSLVESSPGRSNTRQRVKPVSEVMTAARTSPGMSDHS